MGKSTLDDLYALNPIEFEELVGRVFATLGYQVAVTKRSADEGIDLELHRGEERSLAQCKRYRGTVGQPAIRDFFGVLTHERAHRGYFVTTGQFSLAASTWAQGKPISLTDGVDLVSALDDLGFVIATAGEGGVQHQNVSGRRSLVDLVEAALANPQDLGRILIDGAPPDGHSYEEFSGYLERRFPNQTDSYQSHKLRGSTMGIRHFEAWSSSDATVRVLDEFDGLSRALMEEVLWHQARGVKSQRLRELYWAGLRTKNTPQGARREEIERLRDNFENSMHPFVLVATVWERRLPKAVRARFSTSLLANELDWVAIGDPT